MRISDWSSDVCSSDLVARVADAFAALEPSLAWMPRPAGGPFASDNWPEGHANTLLVGPRGLEDRNDLSIGASLLAPQVRYPDHRHAPRSEEHASELQSLMRISYAVFCLKKKTQHTTHHITHIHRYNTI